MKIVFSWGKQTTVLLKMHRSIKLYFLNNKRVQRETKEYAKNRHPPLATPFFHVPKYNDLSFIDKLNFKCIQL